MKEMDTIASFQIDHICLLKGIYVSRKDNIQDEVVTTFDIRMREPNREQALNITSLHTIEHLGATFLRNDPEWKDRVVYFGPMGCLTGCYTLLRGDLTSSDIVDVITRMFEFMADFEGEIPGATAIGCGNYKLHNLALAKEDSKNYLEKTLKNLTDDNLIYPKIKEEE